jgi:hypothetical protein
MFRLKVGAKPDERIFDASSPTCRPTCNHNNAFAALTSRLIRASLCSGVIMYQKTFYGQCPVLPDFCHTVYDGFRPRRLPRRSFCKDRFQLLANAFVRKAEPALPLQARPSLDQLLRLRSRPAEGPPYGHLRRSGRRTENLLGRSQCRSGPKSLRACVLQRFG